MAKSDWKPNRVGNVADVISGYAFKSEDFKDKGIPVIKIKNIRVGYIDLSEVQFADESFLSLSKKYHVCNGDLLISLTGSHLTQPNSVVGRVALYNSSMGSCLLNQRAGKITITHPDKCDVRFLFYTLKSKSMSRAIALMAYGAASQANVSPSQVKSIEINLPPLSTQRKIAAILSAYDNLIENNLRRIQILEEMAQSLYREWFVKFRFPGHENIRMEDSPLGKIPEGWEFSKLENVVDVLESGSRPKGGIDPSANEVPSIGAENILGLGKYDFSKEKYVTRDFFNNMRRGKVQSGDVLLYKDGAQIGRKSLFQDGFPHPECCINEHVFILRTNKKCSQAYLYFWLDQPSMTEKIKALNSNAAQPGINQRGVKGLPILIPSEKLFTNFDNFVGPLLSLLFSLAKKNQTLKLSRDLFLPKLISGELDVSDLEIKTGELGS